jgi:hypothetical protein
VLRAGDLAGFVSQGYRSPSTSAQSWVAEFPPEQRASEAARLKAAGFVAGIGEQLAPAQGDGANREAISVVEQFRSAHGANGEVAAELKQALAHDQVAFAVMGIPGARGFGSGTDANVALSVGPYYLVGFSSGRAGTPARTLTAHNGRRKPLPSSPRLRRLTATAASVRSSNSGTAACSRCPRHTTRRRIGTTPNRFGSRPLVQKGHSAAVLHYRP